MKIQPDPFTGRTHARKRTHTFARYGRWAAYATALALVIGCERRDSGDEGRGRPVPVVSIAKAEQRGLAKTVTYPASVEPVRIARIASPAEGPIVECTIREGDTVTANQILVKVGRREGADAGLEAAREEQLHQQAEFGRVEHLVNSGALALERLDTARANLKQAQAQLAEMKTDASDYELEAPWDGVVARVLIAEGDYVSPRMPLVELHDPGSHVVRISIPERDALAIEVGQPVQVHLDAYPGRQFTGSIARIYPELDRTTRTLTVEAVLDEQLRLLGGMFARVAIEIGALTNAIVVPEEALRVLPGGETVVFAVEGGRAVRRVVRPALEADGAVALTDGVAVGESIIIRGHESLRDGSEVRVQGQPQAQIADDRHAAGGTGKGTSTP